MLHKLLLFNGMEEAKTYDDLIAHQRKERKEFLAKIQQMKQSVPKGNKMKKIEVTATTAQMLADLDLKHEDELKQYEIQFPTTASKPCCQGMLKLNSNEKSTTSLDHKEVAGASESQDDEVASGISNSSQKLSKAQKRRNKKAQHEKARQKAIADQEKDNLTGLRYMESLEIKEKLYKRNLSVYEIPSDGNCLYKAIEHQLSILNLQQTTVKSLREDTARYLFLHKDEYLPFLTHPETGDVLSDEQFQKYCDDIVETPAWGGHVEIQVLSCICSKPIEVIQAGSSSIIIGEENTDHKLIISFHRHMYGLGEHYNSVVPICIPPDFTA